MADVFIDSAATGGADGTTWADAYTTFTSAQTGGAFAATNRILVANTHSESTAAALSFTWPTTIGLTVLSVTPSGASGFSAITKGAIVANTGNNAINVTVAGYAYIYGVLFNCGVSSGAGASDINIGSTGTLATNVVYESCEFNLKTNSSLATITIGHPGVSGVKNFSHSFKNCVFSFSNAGSSIFLSTGRTYIQNMTLGSGTAPTSLFSIQGNSPNDILIEDSDFSGLAITNLFNTTTGACLVRLRNCKLPSVVVQTGTIGGPQDAIIQMDNCDSGDTHINFSRNSWHGITTEQTSTLIRSGGATHADGTAFSFKMVRSATEYFYLPMESPEFSVYNSSTGSSLTATVEILTDSETNLQDDEVWLEIDYQGTTGFPLGVRGTDRMTDITSTPADQTDSSETWDTTGMTNPNTQKLVVTFTPQEVGYVHARVMLAKAATVYVDPYITLA